MKPCHKSIWGWAMYDWANSAFATTVMAGFFPLFFKQYWSFGVDANLSTARLGLANSGASLLIALMAPVLGAMADRGRARKKFLLGFAYLGVLMTACLFQVQRGQWGWAVFVYVLGGIGFSGANVFYDALLPAVASERDRDVVSGLGYALGYLGGGLLFLFNVLMTLYPSRFGLADATEAVRYSFLSVALWWGLFALFTAVWVREEPPGSGQPATGDMGLEGFRQLARTVQRIRHLKVVGVFLLAYWCYIDGVDTIIRMAVDYGISLGFASSDLISALLIVQFVGFPSALAFSKLGQKWGVRRSICLAVATYMGITLWGVFMTRPREFYALAVMIGLVQGGLQALSRSFYSRLIPESQSAEFFGFYNMLGRFAAIIGPVLMGVVGLGVRQMLMPPLPTPEQIVHIGRLASRCSIASVLLLFLCGLVLLQFVDEEKGREEAKKL
ncbi:MAG: MFS transporter [Desulfobacterales bacterium]|nr:MFS transporter [Desulfobacterales bacterium]MDD4073779.1 MFS transporter [Desulfobacterales bacterium]MDD4392060.1 MFS transporter [Desulfobacterales bacterium]